MKSWKHFRITKQPPDNLVIFQQRNKQRLSQGLAKREDIDVSPEIKMSIEIEN